MIRVFGRLGIVLVVFLISFHSQGQKNVTTVGFQVKPIIVSAIGGSGPFTVNEDLLSVDVRPRTGMSFGMVIRTGITDKIAFEAGINRVTRKYIYDFTNSEVDYKRSLDFSYLNYEIPVKGLIFIQLGEDFFMNNSLGVSLDFYASDVASGDIDLLQVTRRGQWAKLALEANLGIEYRTRKAGIIYFGSTFHNPFSSVARSSVRYRTLAEEQYVNFDLNAGYLTLDVKYYFHEGAQRK